MLSKDLEVSLNQAFAQAREKRYEYLTVEHLLLVLLDNPLAAAALKACGADLARLRFELGSFITATTPLLPPSLTDSDSQPTPAFQRVLQRAIFQVQSTGHSEVSGVNVLVAIFGEQDSQAVYFLRRENVARLDVLSFINQGISKSEDGEGGEGGHEHRLTGKLIEEDSGQESFNAGPLENYTVNLNNKAKAGRVDPLIGRNEELARVIQVLCRRRKNNPLLVGEAGVGKTAIAEGLAQAIVNGEVPTALAKSTVYSLDLGGLLAGTKYRGDFEKRFKGLLTQLKQDPHAILFIDEVHTIVGAGAAAGGVLDAANLLKPLLASSDLKCLGATTYQEYRSIIEKDRALVRRFQKIDVTEPNVDETIRILHGLKGRFEDYHGVKYSAQGLRAAVELSARYLTERFLPDKAIDVIDEAGSFQALQPMNKRKKVINVTEIESIVARMAQIPPRSVSVSDRGRLRTLERDLKLRVFGQDQAIEVLSASIKLARSGLRETQKTIGSFLLAGPTGVGKTEIARQLAKLLDIELIRFDMSEYMEAHTVSRLIGAPPGYVGFDQGGLLTEAIVKHPHAVVLLDEIEKAHPDVFNLLLQVMDYGMLTDANGRKADFRHVILIMTTNAGAEVLSKAAIGFQEQRAGDESMETIKRLFSPEFRNRLDAIIHFNYLEFPTVVRVVDKFILELEAQLEEKGVTFELEPAARVWLAEHGYDRLMGARPMARLIQDTIKKPLAEELLFGKLAGGGKVKLVVANDELHLVVNVKTAVAS